MARAALRIAAAALLATAACQDRPAPAGGPAGPGGAAIGGATAAAGAPGAPAAAEVLPAEASTAREGPAAVVQTAPDPALEQFVPEDPEAVKRAAALEERRARFRGLREAFEHGGRDAAGPRLRVEQALAGERLPAGQRWVAACRGEACRVTVAGRPGAPAPPASGWHPLVARSGGVARVADRWAEDPDRREAAVFLLLAPEQAPPGDDLLASVEQQLRTSPDARTCAAKAEATGTVVYELHVDPSGFTYRVDGDLPGPVVSCVNDVLAEIFRDTAVPTGARTASRTVALRL